MNNQTKTSPVLAIVAFLVIAFLMLPVFVVVLAAFSETAYLTIPPKGITFKWFKVVLNDADYLSAAWTSLWLATTSMLASMLLGVMAAYAIYRRIVPGATLLSNLFMAPLVMPSVVLGVALLQYYVVTGMRGYSISLWLAHIVITVPYMIRATLAGLSTCDVSLEDAATVLGANRLTAFWLVTFPIIKPGLISGGLFAFITSFDNVPVTIFLLSASQNTLPVKIFTSVEHGVDPSIAAVSTLLILATAIILVIGERWAGFHKNI